MDSLASTQSSLEYTKDADRRGRRKGHVSLGSSLPAGLYPQLRVVSASIFHFYTGLGCLEECFEMTFYTPFQRQQLVGMSETFEGL